MRKLLIIFILSWLVAVWGGPASATDDNYGAEFDLTATYKIYNNLSYMIGFGYWWVGDYFKGTSTGNETDDDYIVMHKLTLAF